MKKITLSAFLLFGCQLASAQIAVTGTVTDENKLPLSLVVVSLQQGGKVIANSITDPKGNYQFKTVKKGDYKFLFKYIAYKDTALLANIQKDTLLHLQYQGAHTLAEVAVTAKKPIFQRQIDRLRFNVGETDLVFGNNIWDVIEKTPLVNVSADGAIQISGTTGAVVYLNNKRKVLTGNALKNYLSSIPSENLEAIEVMTTPSSKYDAEGGAGILNIITKKNKEEGFIGNASLSARQTAVNSQAGSIYGNNRSGKWNVYSSLYLNNRSRKPEFKKDIYFPAESPDDLLHRSIRSLNDYQVLSPGANLGIDHQINANHVVGLLFDYSGMHNEESRMARSRDFYKNTDSLSLTDNRDNTSSNTYSLNLNYQGKLNEKGLSLSVDADALQYDSKNKSISKTEALDLNNEQILFVKDWFRSSAPQKISNQSVKADFEWPIRKNLSLDFGLKTAFSKINNDLLFENRVTDELWVNDGNRSNIFQYNELINSAYGILNAKVNAKWSYQLGLRVENTIAKGWLEGNQVVNRNYTNLFPTAFLKFTSSKDKSYVLAVSSRINRPGFWDVNPFRTYTTDQTYFEGNPFLMPSKYYREELSHTLMSKSGTFTFQLAASQSLDEIYALPSNPSENVIANKKVNYGNKYGYSGTITYYQQIQPWWRFSGTGLTGYILSKGNYANNILIDNKTFLLSISTNQTFNISKKDGLSCTVIANNTFPATIVNTEIGNRLETELRLRKAIGAWNITLSGQDFFKSNKDRYKVVVNELRIVDENYYDTQSVALSLSFNFGKMTVKDKRDRDTGAEEAKRRI
ncbi:outer membrane beta-barrel protein [Pedobacter gandavensis]|uniref:Outer membrane beta-barrel protein n=1 Tax=Pedobacter gandavensis TaxID=2679963 RepID=A0ABR6ERV8_9SPHI|nr:outer membrane beta-barrel protein [Pedobacter gandavensis]MBB2147998.1 outer membrane beta-barrel protein [Pedobacter gandavensis]